jgi:hypothetical protein
MAKVKRNVLNFFIELFFSSETKELGASGVGAVGGASGANADPGETQKDSGRELFCLRIMERVCARRWK